MARRIILDCDPGHDDAVALVLAHGSPALDLLAVTTVGGNQTLDKVTHNALSVATVLGLNGVPVAAGCDRPLVQPLRTAEHVHGSSGLDGVDLPPASVQPDPRHAVDLIVELVMSHDPGTITLIPTGPLTNIAMAVRREPRIVGRVAEVVLMGGGRATGNATAVAEFNIWTDPEAAHIVFGESWRVVMIGLDLTHQALATPEVLTRLAAIETGSGRLVEQALTALGRAYRANRGFPHPPVHDACAVGYVIDPGLVTTRRARVEVELTGRHTRGMTVVDTRPDAPNPGTTLVATQLDRQRFWDVVIETVRRCG
ncbi:MAG TPA: nucleoside hydrolase [Dermatophilaceae bacterium]|nr:nucleoside hydrolase [Dermatophilaceae bacterium]